MWHPGLNGPFNRQKKPLKIVFVADRIRYGESSQESLGNYFDFSVSNVESVP